MDIIKKILEWPIIVQGALGSALFWLLLVVGQKLVSVFSRRATAFTTNWKRHALSREYVSRKYFFDREVGAIGFGICIYQCLQYATKGIIFITLGFACSNYIPVFGWVGFVGGLYFLLRAAWWVASFEDELTPLQHWERVAELEKRMFGEARSDTIQKIQEARAQEKKGPN